MQQPHQDDLTGNRTRVYAVRGRRLDRLTNRPYMFFALLFFSVSPATQIVYHISEKMQVFFSKKLIFAFIMQFFLFHPAFQPGLLQFYPAAPTGFLPICFGLTFSPLFQNPLNFLNNLF